MRQQTSPFDPGANFQILLMLAGLFLLIFLFVMVPHFKISFDPTSICTLYSGDDKPISRSKCYGALIGSSNACRCVGVSVKLP